MGLKLSKAGEQALRECSVLVKNRESGSQNYVNAEIIKNTVDEFLKREREDEAIVFFQEKRMAEGDWHTEEMDALESNRIM